MRRIYTSSFVCFVVCLTKCTKKITETLSKFTLRQLFGLYMSHGVINEEVWALSVHYEIRVIFRSILSFSQLFVLEFKSYKQTEIRKVRPSSETDVYPHMPILRLNAALFHERRTSSGLTCIVRCRCELADLSDFGLLGEQSFPKWENTCVGRP